MQVTIDQRVLRVVDLAAGLAIALAMALVFVELSSGLSLIVTFVPGLAFSLVLLGLLWKRRLPLPDPIRFLGLYLVALAVQFLHFLEEFLTGFQEQFPALYGGQPYSEGLYVGINMVSYALFALAAVAVYIKGVRAALLPTLFFVVYGVLGNALAHLYWAMHQRGYFPGLYTALAYLLLGPLLLNQLLRSSKQTAIFVGAFAATLLIALGAGIQGHRELGGTVRHQEELLGEPQGDEAEDLQTGPDSAGHPQGCGRDGERLAGPGDDGGTSR